MSQFKDAEAMSPAERWTIAATVMLGAFMAVMDTSVVNVALPNMMGSFGQDLSSITWVATSYSIAEIITATMAGWFSALIGRKNLFLWSFALFTLGSVLCGTATSFEQMLIYRVLQGIGGGALIPLSQAILRESFPQEQQGMAMAMYGMGVVLAPAIGPVLGGWLTDAHGWPWIFYINVPVCIAGMLLIKRFVHDPDYLKRGIKRIDWGGIILLSLAIIGMQIVLERGNDNNWFESRAILLGTIATVLAFITLIFWELKTDEPVINLRVLKDRNLSLGSFIGLVFGISLFGTTFILPQLTHDLLGYPAFQSGLVLFPRAVALTLLMPVVGALYKRFGPRILVMFGLVMVTWSYYDLMGLNLNAGSWNFAPALVIMGIGMPFIFVPMSTVSLSTVDNSQMTDASSLYTLSRRVGGNIGYAVVATLVSSGEQMHRAHLTEHVSTMSTLSQAYQNALTESMRQLGVAAANAPAAALALLNRMIDRQAAMLAYNDISLIFGFMIVGMLPFAFLLPWRAVGKRAK